MTNPGPLLLASTEENWRQFISAWSRTGRALGVKRVHELRVATRKLSASLTLLLSAVGDDRIARVQRQLKKLQKRLGPLRDVQVQLISIRKRSSLSRHFQNSLERIERRERQKVTKHLAGHRRNKLRRQLKDIQRNADDVLQSSLATVIANKLKSVIRSGFEDLATARANLSLFDEKSHHAVRVAARQLRYMLESADSVTGSDSKEQLEMLRSYQTKLGKIRDQQLLEDEIQRMSKSLRHETQRTRVQKLCRDLARSRTRQLKAFFDTLPTTSASSPK